LIGQPIDRRFKIALGIGSVVVFLGAYWILSYLQYRNNPDDTTIPSWTLIGQGIQKLFREGWIFEDSWATLTRLFLGMFFGVTGAVCLGLLMGCHKGIEAFFSPPLSLLAKVPPTAMLAVFFVLVGTDMNMYVSMIAFGILPTMAQSILLGVKSVQEELLFKAYTLGASNIEVVWDIIFRQVLPKILDDIRLQLGPAMVFLIAAEMVCGDVGFGYRIRLEMKLLNMNIVYPYIAMLAAFGFTMDFGLRQLKAYLCPWSKQ